MTFRTTRLLNYRTNKLPYSRLAFCAASLIPFGNGGALVVCLLAFCQCDLDLGAPIFQIDADWNDRHAFDADVVPQFADLLFVQEQTPPATRFMVEAVGLLVGGNVRSHQPGLLAVLDIHKGFLDAHLPGADRLDLTPLQSETCLEPLQQEIFKTSFAVGCYHFDAFSHMDSFYRTLRRKPLTPFQDEDACQEAQNGKYDQCRGQADDVRNNGSAQGADQYAGVQDNRIPCQMRRTIMGRNALKHIVGIGAGDKSKDQPAQEGNAVEMDCIGGDRQQEWIEPQPSHAPAGHVFVAEGLRQFPHLCRADQNSQIKKGCPNADVVICEVKRADVEDGEDRDRQILRKVKGKHRQQNASKRRLPDIHSKAGEEIPG